MKCRRCGKREGTKEVVLQALDTYGSYSLESYSRVFCLPCLSEFTYWFKRGEVI